MARPKGLPKTGGGSRKGRPNKATASLKEAIMKAFQQVGGPGYLASIAQSNPAAFCTLLGKIVPSELQATIDGHVTLEHLVTASLRK